MATVFKPSAHMNFGKKSKARIVEEEDKPSVTMPKQKKGSSGALGKSASQDRPAKKKRQLPELPDTDEDPSPEDSDFDEDPPAKTGRSLAVVSRSDVVEVSASDSGDNEEEDQDQEATEEEDEDDLYTPPALPGSGVSRRTLRRLKSMFGQRAPTIIALLESEDSDGASLLISRTLLQTMVDVLPIIERNVRRSKGQKGIYQMNQVVGQIREMLVDIQATKDRANVGANTVERYIRPAFLDIAVQITTAFVELEAQSRSKMSADEFTAYKGETLIPLKRGLAEYIMKQYGEIQTAVVKSMG